MESGKPSKCCGCVGGKCGCNPEEYCSDVPEIALEDLKEKLDSAEFLLVNVLPSTYFNDCHIPNSINMPLDYIEQKIVQYNKDKPIILYCASYDCDASDKAYLKLKKLGYKNVHVYKGGIKEWKEKGEPCQGPCNKV